MSQITYLKRLRKWLFWTLGIALLMAGIEFMGILLEYDYPYWFLLHRVATAQSANGSSVQQIVADSFTAVPTRRYWYTNSYLKDAFGDHSPFVHVELVVEGRQTMYHFAYDERKHLVVPASTDTAEMFPKLMPQGDTLVPVGFFFGDGTKLCLPRSWINGPKA